MALITTRALGALIVTASFCYYCEAFAPHFLATLGQISTSSMDHKEITEAAAFEVAQQTLLDNPNVEEDSTTVINSMSSPSASSLFAAYYHGSSFCFAFRKCFFVRLKYNDAVEDITDANSEVDDSEASIPKAHFDNEQIFAGSKRLQELKSKAIENIRGGRYQGARSNVGRALHSLQDFYSHSNWVELGNTEPHDKLGKEDYVPDDVAAPSVRTCTGCEQGDEVSSVIDGLGGNLTQAEYEYNCMNNLARELVDNNILTTGYFGHNPETDGKTEGKCSHGGIGDSTSDLSPTGGIGKDSKSNSWSPHFYLHSQAAAVALKATVQYLRDIRAAVGDMRFSAFLNIELAEQEIKQVTSSIAFVIDTTGSMGDELPEIENSLPEIQSKLETSFGGGAAIDFILVPFNDPDPGVVKITQDITELAGYISELVASGGGDCPEPSMGAVIRAARHSQIGGVINLYTDAPASDKGRLSEAESLIKEKRLKVNTFFVEGVCSRKKRSVRKKRQAESNPYQFLASTSGGQVLEVSSTELAQLASILIASVQPSTATIFHQSSLSDFSGLIEFPIDSSISEFLITVNGISLSVQELISPQGQDVLALPEVQVSISSSLAYMATVNVSNSDFHGTWQLRFSSSSSYRVFIMADSALFLMYTLYRFTNGTRSEFSTVKEKVIQGERLLLTIQTDKETEAVNLKETSILNSEGFSLIDLNLTSEGNTFYFVQFEAPNSSFQIQVTGVDNNEVPLSRVNRAGVDITDIQLVLGLDESPFILLRTGDNQTLSLLLYNFGELSTFGLALVSETNTSRFSYRLTDNNGTNLLDQILLGMGEVANINLDIQVLGNVTDSETDRLTILVFDTASSERSNFINVEVSGTTVPPIDPSDIVFYNDAMGLTGLVSHVILMVCGVTAMFAY